LAESSSDRFGSITVKSMLTSLSLKLDLPLLPAAEPAALLVPAIAPGKDRQRIHVTLAAIKASRYQATQTAVGRAFHRAILDATRNLGASVPARRDPHDLERGILVATDGVDGWFEGNLAHHVPIYPCHRRRRRRRTPQSAPTSTYQAVETRPQVNVVCAVVVVDTVFMQDAE
jgi:hypothetical protein